MSFMYQLQSLANRESDSEAERINKSVLILTVLFKSFGCIAWIVMYSFFGLTLSSKFPMLYLFVLVATTIYLYKTKNFDIALYIYIAFILIIPFLLQISLGGFVRSGAVILWSALAPTGALFFKGQKAGITWFILFIVFAIASTFFDLPQTTELSASTINFFFIMNISIVLGVIFCALIYFLKKTTKQNLLLESNLINLAEQKKVIELKNQDITDSLLYSKRIQTAKLPNLDEIYASLPHCFVLYKPKDIVSGDFYYFMKKEDSVFIAAADCTGHGVPGALMSMIGSEKLNDAVSNSNEPSTILNLLNKGIKASLRQSQHDDSTRDGMDIALCRIDKTGQLNYAGANRALWLIRKGSLQLEEIKPTKKAIGGLTEDEWQFDSHTFLLSEGDTLYLATDGYADTFSGITNKKLTTRKFKQLLLDIQDKTMPEQQKHLGRFIENWKSGAEQVDDILVIGIRL
jgi:serine phosphatase RsbU (regulator of sigma subunit)